MRLPRIDALTAIRFFAALWVVLFHYRDAVTWPTPVLAVAQHGSLGVSLFFVLSGFILTYTYHGDFQPGTVLRSYPGFLWARFSRIYPMYLIAVVLYTPLALRDNLQAHGVGVTAASWLANAGMAQSLWPDVVLLWGWNRSLWSIPTEFAFYLAFPMLAGLVLHRLTARRALWLAAGLYALELVGFLCYLSYRDPLVRLLAAHGWGAWPADWGYYAPYLRCMEFALGAALGTAFVRAQLAGGHALAWLATERGRNRALAGIAMALVGVLAAWDGLLGPVLAPEIRATAQYVCCSALFGLLLLTLASGRTALSRLLEARPVVRLGEASYSLYCLHMVVLTPLNDQHIRDAGVLLVLALLAILGTVGLALLTYRFIEAPAQRWLRGWFAERPNRLQAKADPGHEASSGTQPALTGALNNNIGKINAPPSR